MAKDLPLPNTSVIVIEDSALLEAKADSKHDLVIDKSRLVMIANAAPSVNWKLDYC